MALIAAAASSPAIMSFGLCRRIRISKPRSCSTATALAPRRRRGISSSIDFLGTFLHLIGLLDGRGTRRRRQRRDIAGSLAGGRRREKERQRDRDNGALADPALHAHLAAMHGDQAFH